MSPPDLPQQCYRSIAIIGKKPLHFTFAPDAAARNAIAHDLGLLDLPKMQFKGSLSPQGRGDVALRARLTARVVQPCSISLDPVAEDLNIDVSRDYLRDYVEPEGLEMELDLADTEAIPEDFDVAAIAIEELALSLPAFPRLPGIALGQISIAPQGAAPLQDQTLRPFAGLAEALAQVRKPKGKDGAE